MKSLNPDVIFEGGCDYITCVQKGRATDSSLAAFGKFMVQQSKDAGEEWRTFRFSGYTGEHCGSASFGYRHDSQIVRISSHLAREHWNQAFALSTNVTRFDMQVTVLPEHGPTRRLLDHHKQLRRRRRGVGRPPRFKVWYGEDGPEAAVVGRRSSDVFGRIYDKGLESQLEEYSGSLRYEIEFKRKLAVRHANILDLATNQVAASAHIISAFLAQRSLRSPGFVLPVYQNHTDSDRKPESASGTENPLVSFGVLEPAEKLLIGQGRMRRRVTWLHNAVRPTIETLLDQGKEELVLQALGLTVQNGTIARSNSDTWSKFRKWR